MPIIRATHVGASMRRPRERELKRLALYATGLQGPEVARLVGDDPVYHRQIMMHIRSALGAKTTLQAVAACYEMGWLPYEY